MKYWPLLLFAFATTHGAADDLSDFSNDLATDVGPLLVLFGESMTRQYLSESTSFLDYFIFAMAPIGIITAIVSAIRVCGHSTLRAFIGRSQEGHGVVEAELCTSTSRDVCELFNKGGITRVLGRPQILELIHIKKPDEKDELHLFRQYLENDKSPETTEWEKVERYIPGIGNRSDNSSSERMNFAPKPNLSLNVGIKRRPRYVFISIAILGFLLQGGVLALGGVGVWMLRWNLSDSESPASTNYAPIMFITGTIVMCGGMFWCAALIGQTTQEVRYSRKPGTPQSRLVWLQPGPQVIGDQSFDAFAHFENTEKEPLSVWTSSRKNFNDRFKIYTFFAVGAVLLGYISQFIGLRGMKAWVSLAQLGITVIMSVLRGLLRVQRLGRDANKLAKVPDMITGHELDWLSFELALASSIGNTYISIAGRYNNIRLTHSDSLPGNEAASSHGNHIVFAKILRIRERLASLTGHNPTSYSKHEIQQWETSRVKAREPSLKLADAICQVADKLVPKKAIKVKYDLHIQISASTAIDDEHDNQIIDIALMPPRGSRTKWLMNSAPLEAILGLSMWSLVSAKNLHDTDHSGNTISLSEDVRWNRIVNYVLEDQVYSADTPADAKSSIDVSIWFGPDARRLFNDRIHIKKDSMHGLRTFPSEPKLHWGWSNLCGWNSVYDSLKSWMVSNLSNNSSNHDNALLLELAPTGNSLPNICAQDLFLAIVSQLVNTFVPSKTSIHESGGYVLLKNSTVTTVTEILVESGLASPFEALSCAVSLLATKLHPHQYELLAIITETANNYRRNKEWERAETLMQWACLKIVKPNYDQMLETGCINADGFSTYTNTLDRLLEALRATGELYRWSCAHSPNRERLEFGLSGIEWMLTSFHQLSDRISEVKEVLGNYEHVAKLMKDSTSTGGLPQNVPTSKGAMERNPLVNAIYDRDRKMTLWHICFVANGDFDHYQFRPALPLAARNGWTEVVDAILEMKGNLECKDENGRTSISYCAEYGHLSLLQHFISLGASINAGDDHGRTPILFAVKCKQELSAKALLQARLIEHNKYDYDHMTALHWAIRNGLVEILHLLLNLEARLEPDARVTHGSLIMEAAETGNKVVLDSLIERNISVDSKIILTGLRPLTTAVRNGDRATVQLLIMCNAQVDVPDDNLPRPNLLEALENGDEAMTALLLEHTETFTTYPGIWSSLLMAIVCGHWTCAQLVLQKYVASTTLNTGDPTTPPLSTTPPQKAVLDLLLTARDTTSLGDHLSERFSVDAIVAKLLIGNGAKPDVWNKHGETALIVAVKRRQIEMMKAILDGGADVELTDHEGRNALSHACETGNEDIARLILQSDAKVDLTNRWSSPCWFVIRKHQGIRRLLLDAASDDGAREAMRQIWRERDASRDGKKADS